MRLVFLDSGPLGMIVHPRGDARTRQCQRWSRDLIAAGVRVYVPEIADYEVRRKLIHHGLIASLARLDQLQIGFGFAPINRDVILLAAELWAQASCCSTGSRCPRGRSDSSRPTSVGSSIDNGSELVNRQQQVLDLVEDHPWRPSKGELNE